MDSLVFPINSMVDTMLRVRHDKIAHDVSLKDMANINNWGRVTDICNIKPQQSKNKAYV